MNAFNSVQALHNGAAAAIEGGVHDFHVVLRAGQCFKGGTLGDVVDVGGHVGLQVGGCGDNVARANHPAHTPTGHGVGLCHAVENDAQVSELGYCLQDGDCLNTVIGEVFVNLVGQHENTLGQCPFADGAGFLFGVDGTGRVGGGDEDKCLGGGGVCGFELLDGDLVVLVATGENLDGVATCQADAFGVGGPVGGGQQDVVAFVDDGCKGLVDGLLATVGDDNLGGVNLYAGVAQGLFRDGLLQFGKAGGGGVAEVLGVVERLACCVNNVRGGGEVRFACAETDDGASLSLECFCLCVDGKGCGGCDGTDAA